MMAEIGLSVPHELSHIPFPKTGGALLFYLISKPYENTSGIITANLGFGEWVSFFDDAKMTAVLLDKIRYHRSISKTGNNSCRISYIRYKKICNTCQMSEVRLDHSPRYACRRGHFVKHGLWTTLPNIAEKLSSGVNIIGLDDLKCQTWASFICSLTRLRREA